MSKDRRHRDWKRTNGQKLSEKTSHFNTMKWSSMLLIQIKIIITLMPSTHTHTHKAESLHLHNSTSSLTCFSKLWQRGKMMILQMCMRRLTFVIVCDRKCSC